MKILVTGGTGYIGSHTCVELMEAGYETVIVDDLSNSKEEAVERIGEITGKKPVFYKGDVCDRELMERIFREHQIDGVIHFAGYTAVGESVQKPLEYYHNNILSTLVLCEVMAEHQVKSIVFSSSATVYGDPASVPIREDFPLSATNPYGRTKLMIEQILGDLYRSDESWTVCLLRYFNPIGAHKSGLLGEDPNGIPNNLMPYIMKVAVGELPFLNVFGDDYETPDGTGVRDYIHVADLARGHVKALQRILGERGVHIYNLGTGKGHSVLELVKAFEKASGVPVPYRIAPRRSGDIPVCYADTSLAREQLDWQAEYDIMDMCRDGWNYICAARERGKGGN